MSEIQNPIQFAYWVPNVSGGLVTSDIEQRTDWSYDYNVKVAQLAENNGFDYALSQVRYTASYGADQQHESTSLSLGLLTQTERLKVIGVVTLHTSFPAVKEPFQLVEEVVGAEPHPFTPPQVTLSNGHGAKHTVEERCVQPVSRRTSHLPEPIERVPPIRS